MPDYNISISNYSSRDPQSNTGDPEGVQCLTRKYRKKCFKISSRITMQCNTMQTSLNNADSRLIKLRHPD